ncbi:uracil-DNA glycosylase [Undibacterium sp.]|uniref:uracil-DNA glycosylase n=1 Tax=Undibacterium sp. TaxID=1914977 RepID=UPI003753755B
MNFPDFFLADLELADTTWHHVLCQGLEAIHTAYPEYLPSLIKSEFVPTRHRLFAAFSLPMSSVRYVLVGEGPYPREQSATGYCFMDGAVEEIWSRDPDAGLSKAVNRATSLRNFIKMLLVAEGRLHPANTGSTAMLSVAQNMRAEPEVFVQTMAHLQTNFVKQGFLMLNASLVFRDDVSPAIDAKAWQIVIQLVFQALAHQNPKTTLILWGKIADRLSSIPVISEFDMKISEHPYNLSFIQNVAMQKLFAPFELLLR